VLSASVTVEKEVVSSIGKGILVFAAVAPGDTQKEADSLAAKVLKLKLWNDDSGGRVWLRYSSFRLCFLFCRPLGNRFSMMRGVFTDHHFSIY
jgi:hypothetical protein